MGTVEIKRLQANQKHPAFLALDEGMVFAPPDVPLESSDLEILREWRLLKLHELPEDVLFSGGGDPFDNWKGESPIAERALISTIEEADRFYNEFKLRQFGRPGPLFDTFRDIDGLLRRNVNMMLVVSHQRYGGRRLSFAESSVLIGMYALMIGQHIKMEDNQRRFLWECALILNLGMLRRETEHLGDKKAPLSPDEKKLILAHPIEGRILVTDEKKLKLSRVHGLIVETHCEYFDGTGYPKGLAGEKIPAFSRILTLCEEYVSLLDDKPWRRTRLSPSTALRTLVSDGRRKFDPKLLQVLLAHLSLFPVGSVVELGDGRRGVVIGANAAVPLRPKVRVVADADGKALAEPSLVDLLQEKTAAIRRVVEDETERKSVVALL